MIYKVSITFHKDFVKVDEDEITVGITSEPQKGKTNKELLEKISTHFKVLKLNVRIISGEKSRKKLVEIV